MTWRTASSGGMSLFKLGICCDLLTMKQLKLNKRLWYIQELNTLKPDPAWTLGFCHLFQRVCPLQPSHSYHVSLNQAVQWQKLPPLLEELVNRPCAGKMKLKYCIYPVPFLFNPCSLFLSFPSLLCPFSFPNSPGYLPSPTENRQNGCCAGLVCGSPEFRWLQQG